MCPTQQQAQAQQQMQAQQRGRPPDRLEYDRTNPLPRRFVGVVAYDGTDYDGFQTQPSGRTVQDVLESRLSDLFGGRVCVAAGGRTDAGVHARAMTFHFEPPPPPTPPPPAPAPAEELEAGREGDDDDGGQAGGAAGMRRRRRKPPRRRGRTAGGMAPHLADALAESDEAAAMALSRTLAPHASCGLPPSIQVRRIEPAPYDGFHSRDDCVGKRYVYVIHEGAGDIATARFRWTLGPGRRLNVEQMADAASRLVGTHDFSTFGVREASDPRPPVKRMRRLEVRRHFGADPVADAARPWRWGRPDDSGYSGSGGYAESAESESVVTICAECDRYLYNMMRRISGTLVQVGLGRLTPDDVSDLLSARGRRDDVRRLHRRNAEAVKAPAHGLTLERCFYGIGEEEWMSPTAANGADKGGGGGF